MHPRRAKAQDHVAVDDVVARQELVALGRAHGEAGEVVVAVAVEPGHFSRLAADQRAACLAAALGDPRDDRRSLLGI